MKNKISVSRLGDLVLFELPNGLSFTMEVYDASLHAAAINVTCSDINLSKIHPIEFVVGERINVGEFSERERKW